MRPTLPEKHDDGVIRTTRDNNLIESLLSTTDTATPSDALAVPPLNPQVLPTVPVDAATSTTTSDPASYRSATGGAPDNEGGSLPGIMRRAEVAKVEDVQSQPDFQQRLDSFTSPADAAQPVASAQPLQGSSLAVVVTLLTGRDNNSPPDTSPAPARSLPAGQPVPGDPAAGDVVGSNFVVGVQEALEHTLRGERERLLNLPQQTDAVPAPSAAVAVSQPLPPVPSSPAPAAPVRAFSRPDNDQTAAAEMIRGEVHPATAQGQVPSAALRADAAFSEDPETSTAEDSSTCRAACAEAPAPMVALPESLPPEAVTGAFTRPARQEEETPVSEVLLAAVFAAGLSYLWWTDAFAKRADARSRDGDRGGWAIAPR